jgi:hypothetical protein
MSNYYLFIFKKKTNFFLYNRKNYPDIRQQNKTFSEKLDDINKLTDEKMKDKAIVLSNLRRAVALITESLKVSPYVRSIS